MQNNFSKCREWVPRGTSQHKWRWLTTLLLILTLGIGQMWGAPTPGEANSSYLDISKYTTITTAGWSVSNLTNMYAYDSSKGILRVSVYGSVSASGTQKWVSGSIGNTSRTWSATGNFAGSAAYMTSSSKCAQLASSKNATYKVTNCTKVEALYKTGGSSRKIYLKVYEQNADGSDKSTPVEAGTDEWYGSNEIHSLQVTGLSSNKVYKVIASNDGTGNSDFYEMAFTTPTCSEPAAPAVSGTTSYTVDDAITLTATTNGDNHGPSTTYTWYKGDTWAGATKVKNAATAANDGHIFTKTAALEDNNTTYWCEAANGSCTAHSTGTTITVASAGAVESNIIYTETKGANNSNPETYYEGTGITSFTALADVTDFHFTGWSPASIAADATGDQTIEAQWVDAYNVSFSAGAGSGTVPTTFQKWDGAKFNLPGQGSMVAPSGKVFDGWKANGTGDKLAANAEYTMGDDDVEFVAQWKNTPTVIFHYQSDVSSNPSLNAVLTATGGTLTTRSYRTSDQGSFSAQNISNYVSGTPDDMKAKSGKKAIKMNNNDVYLKLALTSGKLQTGDTIKICGYGTIKMYKSITAGTGYNDQIASVSYGSSTSNYGVNTTACVIPQVDSKDVEFDSLCLTRSSNGFITGIKIIRPAQREIASTMITLSDVKVNDHSISSDSLDILTTSPYTLMLKDSYSFAPVIKFNEHTVITYVEGTPATKVTDEVHSVTATINGEGKWQAQQEINEITYTVKAAKALNNDATLKTLTVNGEAITLEDGVFDYAFELPMGTTALPTIVAVPNDSHSKGVSVAQTNIGSATITVTAEDDTTVKEYTITFTVATSKDLLLVFKLNTTSCSSASTASYMLSDNATVSSYINKITFENVEGSGDNGKEAEGSLDVGKKAGNMLILTAKPGYALKAMQFTAKIQDATCEYSLDGGEWTTLSSTNTGGDACYTVFSDEEVREFRLRSTGASGVWIRNMELTIKEKCTPVTLAWTAEPAAEYEITGTQPSGIAAVANNGDVTYESTNTDVIEVDADGDLTLKALGIVTLKAIAPAADGKTYCSDVDPLTKEVKTYYLVTFDPDNGDATSATKYYAGDAAIALPATDPVKENHTFQGWFIGDDQVTAAITPTASVVVKAKWATSYVARIEDAYYTSLPEAVANAHDGDVVYLLKDVAAGPGVMIESANAKDITIDFGDYTYIVSTPAVGSTNTKTQGFHFEQGCTITMQNGTIGSTGDEVKMLVQNYCDLTLLNIKLDGTDLAGTGRYTLSNNCGNVVIGDGAEIVAQAGGVAFDVCYYASYPSVSVTVLPGASIDGKIEMSMSNNKQGVEDNCQLIITGGEFENFSIDHSNIPEAKVNAAISAGTFDAPVENLYCAEGFVPTPEDPVTHKYTVEPKAPLMLVKVVLEAGDNKASIASKSGTFKDDENIKINVAKDLKLSGTGSYVKVAIDGATFQNGDSVVIELASGKNVPAKLQLFADEGTTMIAEAQYTPANPFVEGDNSLIVSGVPANSKEMYIYRTEEAGSAMNPYVQSMAVYRNYLKPVLEEISINGVSATAGANNTFSAKLPNGTNLEGLTIVEKVMSNDPANTHGAIQGSWAWGANTYRVTDADGDYADYTITLTEVAAIASVEISGTLSVEELATTTLSALVKDVNGDDAEIQEVTWATDNAAVATVENGVVTGVAAGTAHITATSTADNTKFVSVEVTVTELPCRTWNAPAAEFTNDTVLGKLKISKGTGQIAGATPYSGASGVYTFKVNGSDRYCEIYYTDGAQFESLSLGVASNASSKNYKYVVVTSSASPFDANAVLSAAEFVMNDKDVAEHHDDITLPEGTRSVRVYRQYTYNNEILGSNESAHIYYVSACKKAFVALTSIAVADKTMAVGLTGTPAVTLTPANADVASYVWEIENDGTGAAVISAKGVISSTATGVVTVKVTATDALNNVIESNVATINIVNKFVEVVPVTATQEWNWTPVSVDANGPTIEAPDTVLANYLSGDEWKMLAGANGDRPYRDNNKNKAYQGYKLSMKTTVPGMLTIKARYASSATVYLKVNGNTVATLGENATNYSVAVPSGDVIITADGSQPMRIYWMKFDTDLAAYELTDNALNGYTRPVTEGRYGTICLPNGGVMVGASIYTLAYYGETSKKIFFDEVVDGTMEAGKPYLFLPNEGIDRIGVFYTDAANEPNKTVNGFVGYIGASEDPNDALQVPAGDGNYIVQNNQYREILTGATAYILSHRAYIHFAGINTSEPAKAPGARRIGISGAPQVVTGVDGLNVGDQPVKLIIDGQMYILRGDKMYDATGRLVK